MITLVPPREHAHLRWHWLKNDDGIRPWEWVNSYWSDGHEGARLWPGMQGGWSYWKPCDPAAIVPDQNLPRWRHVRRGTSYTEIGRAELQMSHDLVEGATLVIYRGDDGKLWARQEDEFEDGRFERDTAKGE